MSTTAYTIGQGEFWFGIGAHDATVKNQFRHLGNIVAGEIAPNITYLDHFKSVEGDRRKDKTVAVTKSISIPFTFDEINVDNLEDFLYAVKATANLSSVLTKTNVPIEGRAIVRFKTNVGTSFSYTIPKCVLKAEGGLAFNAEDWMTGKFTLEVLKTSTYVIPDATANYADYGYVDMDLTASEVLDACETGWVTGPTTPTGVTVTNDSTVKMVGTKSTKIVVASTWAYGTAGVNATNCLGYKTITTASVVPYSFIELYLRATGDVNASDFYLGLETTATPIGSPITYIALPALENIDTWEKHTLAITNRSAVGMSAVKTVGVYGSAALEAGISSTQTLYLDDIRGIK